MVMIISEIGVNHNGDEATAYKLIDAAVEAGADVAKFQLFRPIGAREQYKWLCLPLDAYPRLNTYCKQKGIGFACTAFDADSLQWLLDNTHIEFVKISSGEWDNVGLINVANQSGLLVIQSCKNGLCPTSNGQTMFVVPKYPTPPEFANIKEVLNHDGLSDHSGDIFMPLAAVALGAKIIEAHITLDKNQEGPDHKASLDPQQFKEMARGIRAIEKAMA